MVEIKLKKYNKIKELDTKSAWNLNKQIQKGFHSKLQSPNNEWKLDCFRIEVV